MSNFQTILLLLACGRDSAEEAGLRAEIVEHRAAPYSSETGGFRAEQPQSLQGLQPGEDPWRNTPQGGAITDLNGDDWPDLALLSSPAGPVLQLAGGADGLGVGQPLDLDLAPLGALFTIGSCDLNADGTPELILPGTDGLGIVDLSQASPQWVEPVSYTHLTLPTTSRV